MSPAHVNLDLALKQAILKLGGQSGTVHLTDSVRDVLLLSVSHNVPDEVLDRVREVPWGKGMAGIAAERAEPVNFCNLQTSSSKDIHAPARTIGVRGAIVVPLLHGGDVVGTLGIGCPTERAFTEHDVDWLMDFGRKLAHRIDENRIAA